MLHWDAQVLQGTSVELQDANVQLQTSFSARHDSAELLPAGHGVKGGPGAGGGDGDGPALQKASSSAEVQLVYSANVWLYLFMHLAHSKNPSFRSAPQNSSKMGLHASSVSQKVF